MLALASASVSSRDAHLLFQDGSRKVIDVDDLLYKDLDHQSVVRLPPESSAMSLTHKKVKLLFEGTLLEFSRPGGISAIKPPTDPDQLHQYTKGVSDWMAKHHPKASSNEIMSIFQHWIDVYEHTEAEHTCFLKHVIAGVRDYSQGQWASNAALCACHILSWYYDCIMKYNNIKHDIKNITHTELVAITSVPLSYADLKENPYQFYSYPTHQGHIHFKTVDTLARTYQVDKEVRCLYNTKQVLTNVMDSDGHTCYPIQKLIGDVLEATSLHHKDITRKLITSTVENDEHFKIVCIEGDSAQYVYTQGGYRTEKDIARMVCAATKTTSGLASKDHVANMISSYQAEHSIELNAKQIKAVSEIITDKNIFIVTGFPGTGKSSITRCITYVADHIGASVLLCAPTGKAANRLGPEAKTVHRALECYVDDNGHMQFKKGEKDKLASDIVIVDESSMMDAYMMMKLMRAINPQTTKLVIIGDSKQLPSVGSGDVLRQLLLSKCIRHVELTKIYRQGDGSNICRLSKHIAMGEQIPISLVKNTEVEWINASTPEDVHKHVARLYDKHKGQAQILIPFKKGSVGVHAVNNLVHNRRYNGTSSINVTNIRYEPGEKVVCIRNCYAKDKDNQVIIEESVFNGETGLVAKRDERGSYRVDIQSTVDGTAKTVSLAKDTLELAYALTVHKSQGSEYDTVIIVLEKQRLLLTREVLYTAVTRAKTKLYIVSDEQSIFTALSTPNPKRFSNLAAFIKSQ